MKPANEYPVTFPYGSTKSPYSATRPHKGADRACPIGTPIIINGKTIGRTGNTGASSGPHLHTQAGTDEAVQNTVNPAPYEFKGGTVVQVRDFDPGTVGSWGKFIKIKVGSHYVVYAHLSIVIVKLGDKIGDDMPITQGQLDKLIKAMKRAEPNATELNDTNWMNDPGLAIDTMWNVWGDANYKADQNPTPSDEYEVYTPPVTYIKKG